MTSSDYRARAREMLSGKWGMAILTTFVATLLGGLVVSTSSGFDMKVDEEIVNKLPDFVLTYLTVAASIGGVLGLVSFIIGGTVQLGYCKYLLKLHDGEAGDIKDLFSQFDRFADGFVLSLLSGIYIFLWSLLFVIPGIVAIFKYAMAPFILLENPGMKPNDAITASKEMMDGHKGELFVLDLSFIGWSLLSALTLGIGDLWLFPYMNASYAAFYRQLGGTPVSQPAEPTLPNTPWEMQN